jgi:hypothetical protein
VLDSSDSLSFLDFSGGLLPPIAPEIVAPRRPMVPPNVEESRCACDVNERIGGFDARSRALVDDDGDKISSVEVGDSRSAAIALSKPSSAETWSACGRSSE